ncbi:hypothetical protein ABH931_001240 [Streptacidiphilus sp. MAP12-33]|uniref:hypothetical protein n=1 Tax=Streptacidiphilus sp. MAP12-33 TaxID=3156266 RepID=UPI003517AAE6
MIQHAGLCECLLEPVRALQPRSTTQQLRHRRPVQQLRPAVTGRDDGQAQRGAVERGGAVVADHHVGGDQQCGPLLVRVRDDQAGVQGGAQLPLDLPPSLVAVHVGVGDEGHLIAVMGERLRQLRYQVRASAQ